MSRWLVVAFLALAVLAGCVEPVVYTNTGGGIPMPTAPPAPPDGP